uniref:NAD-dependent epimerase/dehydratase family protein n=1 Tax=Algoriphagus sp. TaxID=1872435 RepID=UPI004048BE9C
MSKVLITGVAGFIGMHIAIRFLKEGWDVVGIDNMNDYYDVNLKQHRVDNIKNFTLSSTKSFKIYYEDLNSSVWNELHSFDFQAVVHLAAQAGVRYCLENPRAYLESNILGFQRVLDFVKTKQVDRFLYASSSSVYGKDSKQPFREEEPCNAPESYYAATKKANELMAYTYNKTFDVSSIGLRFFTVYGPWGRPDMAPMLFASSAFNNESIKVFNHGEQKRDFTYIDDIVEGIIGLVKMKEFPQSAEVCNIGSGQPIRLMDFISEIERNISVELEKEFVEAQKGDVVETYADSSKLFKLSGYRPKVELSYGIKEFVSWYKEYYFINNK